MDNCLVANNISFSIKTKSILKSISLALPKNKITALVGPNGSGKSTLIKLFAKSMMIQSGSILVNNQNIDQYSLSEYAKLVSYLPQGMQCHMDITVEDLVACGRYPYQGLWKKLSESDCQAIKRALDLTQMVSYKNQPMSALSGGQRQRAWIALCLAQQTKIILLDEPTTYLDIKYQIATLNLLQKLSKEQSISIVWVLHDLNQAIKYSDYLIMLKNGEVFASGLPEEIVTEDTIADVFSIQATRLNHSLDKVPFYVF